MPTGWLRVCRGAIAFLGLVALCAPVALATPPDEPAPVEFVAPPADAVAPPIDPPPADAPPADASPVEAPPADAPAGDPSVVTPPEDSARGDDPSSADASPRAAAPSPDDASPRGDDPSAPDASPRGDDPSAPDASPRADERSAPYASLPPDSSPADASPATWRTATARAAAQDPPPDEPAEPPADEPEPEMPPASDPSCVFPQPDPEFEADCQVLAIDCTVLGTPGPDILIGEATADLICGLGGDDEIDGGDGADAILGGEGNDRLTGGPGADCMFGQAGEDDFVDAGEEDVAAIQDGELLPPPDPHTMEGRGVTREGACTIWLVSPQTEPPPPRPGYVSGSVEAAGIVYELSQLINEASDGSGAAFPIDIPATARAEDGVVRLLLECEDAAVSGTLELLERRGDRRVRAGRAEFECTPPSEVVEVELEPAAADRLEDRRRLAVTVRVDAEDYARRDFRVTVRSER
jgi:hypothetical protein